MDLATTYLGLALRNPVIASASPLTGTLDGLRRLEDAGVGAVVLPSIFEEEIEAETQEMERVLGLAHGMAEARGFFPAGGLPVAGPHHRLELIGKAREALSVPVIASLNGSTEGGWTEYARLAEEAGASAIELNVYSPAINLALDAAAVERQPLQILRAVKNAVSVPVAVKLSREYSAPASLLRGLAAAGADGFVLFNRFYQPDLDVQTLRPVLSVALSSNAEIRPGLMWIGALVGQLGASLAASTGVETEVEVIKYLLVGADAVMTTAALLRHGPLHVRSLVSGLKHWGEARGFASVAAMKGRMSRAVTGLPMAGDRAAYASILQGYQMRAPRR